MAVNCLSPHPSNPLEVGSSDVFNKAYKAQLGIGVEIHSDRLSEFVGGYASDSDDPLREIPKMEEYQSHIAEVTGFKAEDTRYIDLDEGMSDDELQEGYGQDDTPRAARTRRAMRYILEDEEDGGEEMEEVEENEGEGEGGEVHNVRHIFDDDEDVVDGQGLDIDEDMEDWGGVEDEEQEQYEDDDEQENEEEHDDLDVHPMSDDIDCFALDESEEEATLKLKPIDEQLEIQHEIQDFKNAVPMLGDDYKLIDRLGTGTFSSVYKAIDLRYHEWDNSPWLGHHPPASSAHYQSVPKPPGSRVFVAIKRIYVTSGPERIKNELLLMELCRGCRHVSQLITAFRHEDQVAIVMPYHRNEDFREYFMELPMPGIKEYFRCLLRALRDIHARHIIHRDVKPANFLFDPRTGQGSLCDFGLAQRFDSKAPAHGACLHTTMSKDDAHGKYRTKSEYNSDWVRSQQVAARKKSKTRAELHAPRALLIQLESSRLASPRIKMYRLARRKNFCCVFVSLGAVTECTSNLMTALPSYQNAPSPKTTPLAGRVSVATSHPESLDAHPSIGHSINVRGHLLDPYHRLIPLQPSPLLSPEEFLLRLRHAGCTGRLRLLEVGHTLDFHLRNSVFAPPDPTLLNACAQYLGPSNQTSPCRRGSSIAGSQPTSFYFGARELGTRCGNRIDGLRPM
ncbi:hypothetical protein DFP72DRAFT_1172164 [Ephemerocybe angulata]|uniref:mitogen-activated protein kinase kinase n=1 Tax=Ephemerocybe angulata TaxID=980116 RepID=A0A8H6HQS2_9AGAR|nr:hypothetical protein DFP72DRAFT_1172164 [Tulosesus angulatus]